MRDKKPILKKGGVMLFAAIELLEVLTGCKTIHYIDPPHPVLNGYYDSMSADNLSNTNYQKELYNTTKQTIDNAKNNYKSTSDLVGVSINEQKENGIKTISRIDMEGNMLDYIKLNGKHIFEYGEQMGDALLRAIIDKDGKIVNIFFDSANKKSCLDVEVPIVDRNGNVIPNQYKVSPSPYDYVQFSMNINRQPNMFDYIVVEKVGNVEKVRRLEYLNDTLIKQWQNAKMATYATMISRGYSESNYLPDEGSYYNYFYFNDEESSHSKKIKDPVFNFDD